MFESIDLKETGRITLDQWISFWREVHNCGHGRDEILDELTKISAGESWQGFGRRFVHPDDPSVSKKYRDEL